MKVSVDRSKVTETRRKILGIIKEGDLQKDGRLPSEEQMCEICGVSRATVRAALGELESSGIIQRKHGLGTFVNSVALQINARLESWIDFIELIESAGYKATMDVLSVKEEKLDPAYVKIFNMNAESRAVTARKLFLAGSTPAIVCQDAVPIDFLQQENDYASLKQIDIFSFLAEQGLGPVSYGIARIIICIAEGELAHIMDVPDGTPLLKFENIAYTSDNKPLFISNEIYRPGLIDFNVVRRFQ